SIQARDIFWITSLAMTLATGIRQTGGWAMKTIGGLAVALFAMLAATGSNAQTGYPEQPIRILVGFTPGVAPDITSRLLAEKFSMAWGKPAVVENVTGAGGNIATERAAKAAPDGYTLLMGGN